MFSIFNKFLGRFQQPREPDGNLGENALSRQQLKRSGSTRDEKPSRKLPRLQNENSVEQRTRRSAGIIRTPTTDNQNNRSGGRRQVVRNRNQNVPDEITVDQQSSSTHVTPKTTGKPNKTPVFYNTSDLELSRNAEVVEYNEEEMFVTAEKERRKKIRRNPILRDNYKSPEPEHPDSIDFGIEARKRLEVAEENKRIREQDEKYDPKRLTPFLIVKNKEKIGRTRTRIQIVSNITGNKNNVIPVFCDVSDSVEDCKLPETLNFKYVERNESHQLLELEEELQEDRYLIKCMCHNQIPPLQCWENESCPCYKRNRQLRAQQKEGMNLYGKAKYPNGIVKFSSFDPLLLNPKQFYYTVGNACSKDCGCKGQCHNNATLLLDNHLISLVLERKSMDLGFQTGSLNFVPIGTVVAEMTGRIVNDNTLKKNKDAAHYSFQINYGDDEEFKHIPGKIKTCTDKLRNMLEKEYKTTWHIDTSKIGSVARMLNHSCEPNCDTIRVFQGGFSPSNIRILIVTTEPIFFGEQYTIDYGAKYKFADGCKCGTVSCINTKVENVSEQQLTDMLKTEYTEKYEYYHKVILPKVNARGWIPEAISDAFSSWF